MEKKLTVQEYVVKETLMNMPSSITDVLIKEAAQCERFASDLFIDYANLHSLIAAWDVRNLRNQYYFGFRDFGVDSETAILCGVHEYRCIYKLELEYVMDDIERFDKITFSLCKVDEGEEITKHTDLLSQLTESQAAKLWSRFKDILDSSQKTKANFLGFPAGTKAESIEKWFAKHYKKGTFSLLYGNVAV